MSRSKALILGVFSCWPVFYMLAFLAVMLLFAATRMITPSSGAVQLPFKTLFFLHFLTVIEIVILLVIYLRFLFKTDRVPKSKKALWAVVLFLGNMVAMPVFWYLYIWREPGPSVSLD